MADRERAAPREAEAPAEEQAAAEQSLEELLAAARKELEDQKNTAVEYLKLVQRVQADFLNYKRRVEAERESQAEIVRGETLLAFLPLVDDFERALAHLPSQVRGEDWAAGFGLIERNLETVFERLGVQSLGVEGEPFDPNVHEAVSYEEHPTQPEGHVAAVLRPGYRIGDRVVRPAQVSVARAPEEPQRPADTGWRGHSPRRGNRNGDVDRADLRQPRNIEQA